MKKMCCVLVCLIFIMSLSGCAQEMGMSVAESLRGESMRFSFSITYEKRVHSSLRLMGEGAVTGLLQDDMQLEVECAVYHSEDSFFDMGPFVRRGRATSASRQTQLHYRGGSFYSAKQGLGWDGWPDLIDPGEVTTLTPSQELLQQLLTGNAPAGTINNVSVQGRAVSFDVATGSELGQMVSGLITMLENNGEDGNDTEMRITITVDENGRFEQIDVSTKRVNLFGERDIDLNIEVDSFGGVEAIEFPSYVR